MASSSRVIEPHGFASIPLRHSADCTEMPDRLPFREDRPATIDRLRLCVAKPTPWSTARRSSPRRSQGRCLARRTARGGGAPTSAHRVVTSPHPPSNSHRPNRPSASDGSSGCASQRTSFVLSHPASALLGPIDPHLPLKMSSQDRNSLDFPAQYRLSGFPAIVPLRNAHFTLFSGIGFTLRIAGYPRYIRVLRLPRFVFSWNACFRTVSEHQTHPTNCRISPSYLGLALTSVCFLSRSVFSP